MLKVLIPIAYFVALWVVGNNIAWLLAYRRHLKEPWSWRISLGPWSYGRWIERRRNGE